MPFLQERKLTPSMLNTVRSRTPGKRQSWGFILGCLASEATCLIVILFSLSSRQEVVCPRSHDTGILPAPGATLHLEKTHPSISSPVCSPLLSFFTLKLIIVLDLVGAKAMD